MKKMIEGDVESSSTPGIAYKVEKETHCKTDRDINVQTVQREGKNNISYFV